MAVCRWDGVGVVVVVSLLVGLVGSLLGGLIVGGTELPAARTSLSTGRWGASSGREVTSPRRSQSLNTFEEYSPGWGEARSAWQRMPEPEVWR